jgi:hypothetical protein
MRRAASCWLLAASQTNHESPELPRLRSGRQPGFPHSHRLGGYEEAKTRTKIKNGPKSVKYVPGLKCKSSPRLHIIPRLRRSTSAGGWDVEDAASCVSTPISLIARSLLNSFPLCSFVPSLVRVLLAETGFASSQKLEASSFLRLFRHVSSRTLQQIPQHAHLGGDAGF